MLKDFIKSVEELGSILLLDGESELNFSDIDDIFKRLSAHNEDIKDIVAYCDGNLLTALKDLLYQMNAECESVSVPETPFKYISDLLIRRGSSTVYVIKKNEVKGAIFIPTSSNLNPKKCLYVK